MIDNTMNSHNTNAAQYNQRTSDTDSGCCFGRFVRVLAGVTCLLAGAGAAVAAAFGLYPLATALGLISITSGLIMLYGCSKNRAKASGASAQPQPGDSNVTGVTQSNTTQSQAVTSTPARSASGKVDRSTALAAVERPHTFSTAIGDRQGLAQDDLRWDLQNLKFGLGRLDVLLHQLSLRANPPRMEQIAYIEVAEDKYEKPEDANQAFHEAATKLGINQKLIQNYMNCTQVEKSKFLREEFVKIVKHDQEQQKMIQIEQGKLHEIQQALDELLSSTLSTLPDPDLQRYIKQKNELASQLQQVLSKVQQPCFQDLFKNDKSANDCLLRAKNNIAVA